MKIQCHYASLPIQGPSYMTEKGDYRMYAFDDLRGFLQALDDMGKLNRIEDADWDLLTKQTFQ